MQNIDITTLTGEQLDEITALKGIWDEARRMYGVIASTQTIPLLCEDECILWDDSNNQELLVRCADGWHWGARYLNSQHDVALNPTAIFNRMRDAYYFDKNPENQGRRNTAQQDMRYFGGYVRKLEQKNRESRGEV